ncbi:MAG: hypothetical protein JST00_34955 [Deltaproteobacteria bacterium]|nr:hypothetical protein [Deltaproteobacteria bacterium]
MKALRVAVALGAFVHVAACEDPPGRAWLVDRTRVLDARVSAASDPIRASIVPGEAMRVSWLVVAPGRVPSMSWAAFVCAAPPGRAAAPRCEGPIALPASGTASDGTGEIVMDLLAPSAAVIANAEELLVIAAFCETGPVTLDPARFDATCAANVPGPASEGTREPLLASVRVRLESTGRNANPTVAEEAVAFDGAPIALPTPRPAGAPCVAGPAAPFARAGSAHAFGFRFRGSEREPGETLLLTHAVTAGELDRARSSLEVEDAVPKEVVIPWSAPADVPEGGLLVEAFFVVRDGRGGSAFARRTVCVGR